MTRLPQVAYFCMEYGLDESFPIYSGGLGVLAGDFIKTARDLDRPIAAVGLLCERGYCTQRIGPDGQPKDEFPTYDQSFLRHTGVRVRVRIRGSEVECAVRVTDRFGHVPLYLLQPQRAEDRWITQRLYEAGTDVRIAQEMLLGIGGVRALNWLGIQADVYHFNEGHAVFAGIEMIADRMQGGMPFPDAWADTRRRIVFTTHTPVKAGNEEHSLKDLRRMGACLELSGAEIRALGGDPFNMTVAGLRLSRNANAVSRLHAETARAMWAHVSEAAPIIGITNGVHAPTWQSPEMRAAGTDHGRMWEAHERARGELFARVESGTGVRLDPDLLWIGLARRAAGYKRNDLLLRDESRLDALLKKHRVGFRLSGKAHPDDAAGKAMVGRLVAGQRRFPGRIVFLDNYDLAVARSLTRGCDAWLNTPIRPMEASGTSGMKAALNGLPNISVLDGWWAEGCEHGVNGWAIGGTGPADDDRDRATLFDLLESEVIPAWADRERWLSVMQASVRTAVERFTSERMMLDYYEKLYPPPGPESG